nr:hypothetical protein [Tanacetum cinerariifolium]
MFFSPSPTPCGGSDLLLGEIYTILSHFNDSLPDYETFCFDIEEKSSGSTTFHFDHSLPEYESLCFDVDHIKEKIPLLILDFSLIEYDSFIFDHSIDPFPPDDRSVSHHEEFVDELPHIISPSKYDRFYFDLEDDPVEVTRLFKENIPKTSTEDLTCNELSDFPLILSDCNSSFVTLLFVKKTLCHNHGVSSKHI